METSEISHRVADFLKRHPPFTSIDEADLLALAATGRVRFHEAHDYILSQGEPHRHQVYVIQQGTVSLWDDAAGGRSALRDVRGAGDMLGLERFNGAGRCLYTVRAESDVVIYAFPEDDFTAVILSNPDASQHIQADARVVPDEAGPVSGREPHRTPLSTVVRHESPSTCRTTDTVADVASRLLEGGGAIAVLTTDGQIAGVLTADNVVGWAAAGGGAAKEQMVGELVHARVPVLPPDAFVSDGVLALCGNDVGAVGITADGNEDTLRAVITRADLSRFFRDMPHELLDEIVGHHISHDIATIDAAFERLAEGRLLNRSLDTMDLTLHLERDGALAGRGPVRQFTLDSLCTMFNVVPHDRHTAAGDAFITAQVFLRLLRLAVRSGRSTLVRITEPFPIAK